MFFTYNGVTLELLTIDTAQRIGLWSADGIDLIGVKWLLGVTCVYSPGGYPVGTAALRLSQAARDSLYPQGGAVLATNPLRGVDPRVEQVEQETNVPPSKFAGFNAAMTDAELRYRLLLPRKTLLVTTLDAQGRKVEWLRSPKPGFPCDLVGGPRPLSCDVVAVQGLGQTFGVHFQIETVLSPCPDGSDRLILSHRWVMAHDHDDDFYLTRTISGEVVFNLGLLQAQQVNPDWFRNQFFHPIPLGFKRHGPKVALSSDGATLSYEVADTDQNCTFDAGDSGATNMSIIEQMEYSQPAWMTVVDAVNEKLGRTSFGQGVLRAVSGGLGGFK